MVKATAGVLVTGDVALIEFIRWLNESQLPAERFIINGSLDDTHLFIKESKVEFVQKKVDEWQQSLRFEPSAREHQ
ncbi:hypothetical protein D9Q98_002824 [Chlorella vulgaris]|uniref:General transcription and DNA repair factor IIH subunit TFB5 n=1 Tax=Chlorella vulgaris TaxID=3077 RepID=A0A9D4TTZ9_CHLVU|nr:hypothetical protein D9Q98_002824 [Chlorella vulgaris]